MGKGLENFTEDQVERALYAFALSTNPSKKLYRKVVEVKNDCPVVTSEFLAPGDKCVSVERFDDYVQIYYVKETDKDYYLGDIVGK